MLDVLFIFGIAIYFIPSFIGYSKRNGGSILALNFLLGWTFIGWVVALVWALSNDEEKTISPVESSIPSNLSEELLKLSKLKEDGLLSEEEFNAAKSKLLNS